MHDVGSPAVNLSDGIQLSTARQGTIRGNHVHSIGPGGESDGVRLINARDTRVADNVIELVRKEIAVLEHEPRKSAGSGAEVLELAAAGAA